MATRDLRDFPVFLWTHQQEHLHLLEDSQHDLNWHVLIHWIVEAEEGLFNLPDSWISIVLLQSGNDLWGCKRPESSGSRDGASCVVRFVNCII